MRTMSMLQLLMLPANAVCDRIGLTNEHERGMMRMLVNMLLCSGFAVLVVFVGWKLFA
jgi:hypothetical protein